jgi:hypothetical protein
MGDWYEIKELAGVYYIEYQNADSEWQPVAVKLTDSQVLKAEAFEEMQAQQKHEFYKLMAVNAKA